MHRHPSPVRAFRRSQHLIESVETRRLLATLVGTELQIEGTAGNDRIRVETVGANIVVNTNGKLQSFATAKVKTILSNLRRGHDRIDIGWNVKLSTTISGEAGNDTIVGGMRKDAVYTGSGNDVVYGRDGGDFIQTATDNDTVFPGSGNDTVDTGAGQDLVSYSDRASPITSRMKALLTERYEPSLLPSYPYVAIWQSTAQVTAGSEVDGVAGLETLAGGGGNDTLSLETDAGMFVGDETHPLRQQLFRVNGDSGNDSLRVTSLNDYLPGAASRMVLDGGTGDDRISGYARYTAIGGAGNDEFFSNESDDSTAPHIDAGGGIDTFTFGRLGPTYVMPEGLENLNIRVETSGSLNVVGNDLPNVIHAYGGYFGATIDARGGNDFVTLFGHESLSSAILGGAGNDTIIGGLSADSILGGDGDDFIDGGFGMDSIYGGAGTDTAKRDGADAIVDSIEVFV